MTPPWATRLWPARCVFMDTNPNTEANTTPAPEFWRGVFSEADGSPSFSRVATAVAVAFAVGWTTALVRQNHALPDFGGMTCFVGTLYGVNKLASAFGRDR